MRQFDFTWIGTPALGWGARQIIFLVAILLQNVDFVIVGADQRPQSRNFLIKQVNWAQRFKWL